MGHKTVRVGERSFDVMWADVKDGVLTFKALNGDVWTTNHPFIVTVVTERDHVAGTEGRGEVGESASKTRPKRLRKARKSD